MPGRVAAAAPAVLLRSSTGRASRAPLLTLAVVVGVVSGSIPAGLMDRPDGTGILVGGSAALTGTAAISAVVLAYLVIKQLGGADEAGRLRDLYLQDVTLWIPRAGAVLAAIRDWLWFTLAAGLTGCLIGLGDGLRVNDGDVTGGVWVADSAAIGGAELYVLLLAVLWGTLFQNTSLALLCAAVAPIFALALVPLAAEPWLLAIVKSTPLAPLWAAASGGVSGRYDLAMSDTARYVSLASWSVVSAVGTWLASRGNNAAGRRGRCYPLLSRGP